MINANDSVNNHFKVHRSASLLDVLIEFDKFLDDLNVYSYENWLDGEIVDGPHLTRYWCEVSLMYPYEQMPDPAGGERLLGKKCKVYYKQDYYGDAIAELERFKKVYPKHKNIDYANYLLAICFYEQIVDEKKDLNSIVSAKKKISICNKRVSRYRLCIRRYF